MSRSVCTKTLVVLTLAFLGLARTPPTSTNDPLFNVAKLASKPPEQPICCLVPLPSNELSEEILSFEDWKAKQLHGEGRDVPKPSQNVNAQESALDTSYVELTSPSQPSQHELPSPSRLRVPIVDRFNYANIDCSARVHVSHRSAKFSSSILSSKKDKYMLSPCNTPGEGKFVVIELCEDISIDTVQLANFEFFSGIFKDFTVKVAKTLASDDSWTFAGTYTAKNIRGIQTFHLPVSVRDFYRFIKVEFHSNYGNEFYCPLSVLRVFGLTHLEQYKWEEWEAESRASRKVEIDENAFLPSFSFAGVDTPSASDTSTHSAVITSTEEANELETAFTYSDSSVEEHLTVSETLQYHSSSMTTLSEESYCTEFVANTLEDTKAELSKANPSSVSFLETEASKGEHHSSIVIDSSSSHDISEDVRQTDTTPTTDATSTVDNDSFIKTTLPSVASASASMPVVVPHLSHTVSSVSSAGESIYRTIMTRLTFLETNSSLYLRYVEEQSRSLREAMRRLEEDVGRLEGIGKAQSQFFQRTMQDWDRQKKRLEREHGELLSRVNFLSDEVVLEKRLGIAQLCLLLIVLLFMFITRGSRGESFIEALKSERQSSLRDWGRRQLSNLSRGEWNTRSLARSSSTPTAHQKSPTYQDVRTMSKIRSRDRLSAANSPISPIKHRSPTNVRSPGHRQTTFHRPRTPVTPRVSVTSALAPTSAAAQRPLLRRASSHNSPSLVLSYSAGASPLSTKKWAKTSHLHEVRRTPKQVPCSPQDENVDIKSDQKLALSMHTKLIEEMDEQDVSNRLKNRGCSAGDIYASDQRPHAAVDSSVAQMTEVIVAEHSQNRSPLSLLVNRCQNDISSGTSVLPRPWQPRAVYTEGDAESELWIDTDLESEAGE